MTLSVFTVQMQAEVAMAMPLRACEALINTADLVDKIVIVERGDCTFVDKVIIICMGSVVLVQWIAAAWRHCTLICWLCCVVV